MDLRQYLNNCAPTPALTQQQSTDNKPGLMLGKWRGRCAVAQILTLIKKVTSLELFDPIFRKKKLT